MKLRLPVLLTTALLLLAAPAFSKAPAEATPTEEVEVAKGFKVELLKSATPREGSWVSMAIDDKGRLYISPQAKSPDGDLMRVTLDARGQVAKTEWIKLGVGAAMGMLWAFDSLYVSGQGPDGQAIYRLRDTDGDDALDKVELFKKVPGGGGEHGAHAMVVGPDNKIYITHGNGTPPVEGLAPDSPMQHQAEDDLLPRIKDPVATFFDKLKVPYGQVLRTDADGKKWELFAAGFRNAYDIDFNADGELFTYDSDMEWDVGLPWYRPTRVLHVVPGGDYGFREGTAKWPAWYPDSLPPVVDIGLGCPTGVKFGTRSNFPEKYRRAFFIMDWTFGRILAVHLHPQGASYTAKNGPLPRYKPAGAVSGEDAEVFLSGKGMPVTDMEFGKDGAMYFTVGGRGTQAGLYRVSYVGEPDFEIPKSRLIVRAGVEKPHVEARQYRRELEGAFDGRPTSLTFSRREALVRAAESYDRAIFFAARLRAEQLPQSELLALALEKSRVTSNYIDGPPTNDVQVNNPARVRALDGLMGLLALARVGDKSTQEPLLRALAKFPLDSLDEDLKLLKLRVIELSFIRQGRPSDELVQLGIEKLSRQYPAKTFDLNRELVQLLVFLGAPDVVEKTLALMDGTSDPAEQIWYALCLREAKQWTPEQRERYFAWFNKARDFRGGNSLGKFVLRIREEALTKLTDAEKAPLAAILDPPPAPAKPATPAVARPFQKNWTVADLAPELDHASKGRNFARGKEIFASVQCLQCHHFGQEGGNVGPDISAAGSRFNRRDLLEAIVEPSKAISEQYASYVVTTKKGETLMGQIAEDNNDHLTLITDPIAGTRRNVGRMQVESREVSPVSLMPPGLINVLTKDEILDLLAYIESGGNEKAPAFAHEK